ncbi:sugar ABC transporter substrate-binding protein [Microbacterium yannicii]|uniref:sugar ABC transporter substrate-binding protein n=1 Tax=Microbacterium yannicii TaxID=671622 RepID=UPI00036CA587|nr:substrate-binding domain-containing protein [Microbacterium yannicii]
MFQSPGVERTARAAVLMAAAALVLSACSSIGDSAGGEDSGPAVDTAMLEAGYAGAFDAPPSDGPAAQPDKSVWYISCGQSYAACAGAAESFAEAGDALGWNVTIQDGKADPNTAASIIRQGVAAGVDGIGLFTYDCPAIKSALLEARDAGVPVVNFGSLDCDDEAFGSEEPLFAASVNEQGSTDQADLWKVLGEARATYSVASLGGEPGKIINIWETSQRAHQWQQVGFTEAMDELCPECEVVNVEFTFAQVPNRSSEIFKAALAQNPDVGVVTWDTDALMGLGLSTVLQQAGLDPNVALVGAEGNPPNMEHIRKGEQTSSSFIPYSWYQWAMADTFNRIFAGEDPASLPSQGGGYMFIDAENNLPEEGEPVELPIDYKAAYTEVWNG